MRTRWIASFALSLAFLASTARAGDDPWRLPPTKQATAAPAVKIGKPIAVEDLVPPRPPLVDGQVRPTAFDGTPPAANNPAARPQAVDPSIPRPLPVGTPSANLHTWTRDDWPSGQPLASTSSSSSNTIGKPVAADDSTLPPPRVDSSNHLGPLWARFTSLFSGGGYPTDCGDCGNCGNCAAANCPAANCFAGCCNDCGCYNSGNHWYVSAETLLWWMKGDRVPPLVTTGSATDTVPGALGQPGTRVLYGDNDLGSALALGGRFMVGYWFTCDHCLGLEGGYWFLGSKSNNFAAASTGDPLLFRPFTDETGAQNVELVAVPSPNGSGLSGAITVSSRTSLWGTEANFRSNLWCGPRWYIDGLAGFRAMGLDDNLNINEALSLARGASINGTSFPAGTSFLVSDNFRTQNRFYGGQVGLDAECRLRNWIFGVKTKVALGNTNSIVDINGGTVINVPGQGASAFNGGLLTQNSNIGHYSRDQFSVVPEIGLLIGYQFNEHWRASIGYNFLYWSSVARAGGQIDTVVNRNQLPPPVSAADRPAFMFHNTDFWAQGITFGIEFKW
jgi:hypothetical protein